MKRVIFISTLIILNSIYLYAQDIEKTEIDTSQIEVLSLEHNNIDIEYKAKIDSDLFVNSIIPGYWQIQNNDVAEGILYMSTLPNLAASTILMMDYLLPIFRNEDTHFIENNNSNYIFYTESAWNGPDVWKRFASILGVTVSSLFYSYSNYEAKEEYYRLIDDHYFLEYGGKFSLLEFITSPWQPEHLFNFDFFPAYPLFALLGYNPTSYKNIPSFFERETVPFLGGEIHPAGGAILAFGSSILLSSMVAVTEEITYRSHYLRENGLTISSITFGAAHLPNMINPNVSIENTIYQTLFATLFGYYAGYQTEKNGYDFRRMIALHFWHNVTVFSLNYLIEPDTDLSFTIGATLSF